MRMTLANLLGLLVFAALPLPVRAENLAKRTFEVETIKDVAYYEGDAAHPVKHKLDLFLPKGHKDFPVLFFVHGGSWRHGDKGFLGIYSNIGRCFAEQGIGTVVINYRLSPSVKHPEHIKDVALDTSPGPGRTCRVTAAGPIRSLSSATRRAATWSRCWPRTRGISRPRA